jgi:broad specificity phosphatase PhoE
MTTESQDERTIYLLRHGEPLQEPGGRRYIGRTDLPLSPAGLRQAEQWHSFFNTIVFSAVFCSDLRRSTQTARIIAHGRPFDITRMPELREVNMGEWEGLPFETVRSTDRPAYDMRGARPADHRPPSGESFRDLHARVVPAFERIAAQTAGSFMIVGHAGVNRVLLCHLLGMPLDHLFRIGQYYAALNIIEANRGGYRVALMNMRVDWKQ